MKHALLVFLGGGLGSALRYGFGKIFQTVPGAFPMSTFTVNILGCFLIGIFMGYGLKTETLSENQSILLITGFCGGFTTCDFALWRFYNLARFDEIRPT